MQNKKTSFVFQIIRHRHKQPIATDAHEGASLIVRKQSKGCFMKKSLESLPWQRQTAPPKEFTMSMRSTIPPWPGP